VSFSLTVRRTARYEMLGTVDAPISELWFVLHGYGQLASTFVQTFSRIEDGTRLIVAPEALNRFYLAGIDGAPAADRPVGATWMTREYRESEIGDYVAYLDAVAARVRNALRARRATPRIIVLGFSQGAATAARWVARGGVGVSHLVLWGGLLPPELAWPDPDDLAPPSLHILIGSRDRFVTTERLAEEETRMRAARVPHRLVRYEGGHGIDPTALDELVRTLGA
jgi:predicted esterase